MKKEKRDLLNFSPITSKIKFNFQDSRVMAWLTSNEKKNKCVILAKLVYHSGKFNMDSILFWLWKLKSFQAFYLEWY